mmetsp:Transcript_92592/g.288665  ORF Transcript_92592/g.288665 Transcript_92592/m.288665 type:complete len:261 (+) Transcript_92592:855-1637(+)
MFPGLLTASTSLGTPVVSAASAGARAPTPCPLLPRGQLERVADLPRDGAGGEGPRLLLPGALRGGVLRLPGAAGQRLEAALLAAHLHRSQQDGEHLWPGGAPGGGAELEREEARGVRGIPPPRALRAPHRSPQLGLQPRALGGTSAGCQSARGPARHAAGEPAQRHSGHHGGLGRGQGAVGRSLARWRPAARPAGARAPPGRGGAGTRRCCAAAEIRGPAHAPRPGGHLPFLDPGGRHLAAAALGRAALPRRARGAGRIH